MITRLSASVSPGLYLSATTPNGHSEWSLGPIPIPDAAQCCLLYSALAPEGVYGTVLLPALFDVENEAGPVLVAEVKDFRLVSAPSMMKRGVCGGLNVLLHLRARNQLCREIVWRNIAQLGLVQGANISY